MLNNSIYIRNMQGCSTSSVEKEKTYDKIMHPFAPTTYACMQYLNENGLLIF